MIHHLLRGRPSRVGYSLGSKATAPPPVRFPILLALPVEIVLGLFEMLPPEAIVSAVCCCWYMYGLYCEDGTYAGDQLWDPLLRRTFPSRLTGAPGPNAPPRVRKSPRLTLCSLAANWCQYVRDLRASPQITGVQIAKFVRWAASAHSWYKHLPLQDAAVFSFVLDLTVGMKRTPEGFVEQHEGDARTHYSWLPTRAYREAFGLLTYRDALPAFQPQCASGPRSVSVQRTDATRVWLPSHLVEVGSCRITAACHGRAEAYQIYHHAYDAFCQARISGSMERPLAPPPRRAPAAVDFSSVQPFAEEASPSTASAFHRKLPEKHSYSYLSRQAQREAIDSLPPEVVYDFELLHAFELSGQDHSTEAQCALIQKLFPCLSPNQVAKLQEQRVWGSPWQPGGAYLGAPDIVVTAEKAREWQRMFDHAAAFCEQIYGEKISMEGIRQSTMTCLALETLPLPVYDIMGM